MHIIRDYTTNLNIPNKYIVYVYVYMYINTHQMYNKQYHLTFPW